MSQNLNLNKKIRRREKERGGTLRERGGFGEEKRKKEIEGERGKLREEKREREIEGGVLQGKVRARSAHSS